MDFIVEILAIVVCTSLIGAILGGIFAVYKISTDRSNLIALELEKEFLENEKRELE